ncbi:hypothetical protein LPJ74_006575, partial [Coemansia sp. RSA 1843]
DTDPRLKLFRLSAWVDVFKNAGDCAGRDTPMPHLEELRKYVSPRSRRRISFISQPTIQPLNNPEDHPRSPSGSIVEEPSNNDNDNPLYTPTRTSVYTPTRTSVYTPTRTSGSKRSVSDLAKNYEQNIESKRLRN